MHKVLSFVLVVVLAVSSVLWSISASAQAISTPSVPQFTVKQVDRSYDVPTTYSKNQYTGETITYPGYHVQNKTIDVLIKNQPFTPSTVEGNTTGLFYNVQAKINSENWSNSLYSDSHNKYAFAASTSEYTIVSFIIGSDGWYLSDGSQVDIRVQAVTGYSYYVWSLGGGPIPIGTQFRLLAASDWSNIQTITIGYNGTNTTPPASSTQTSSAPTTALPTENPTAIPTQTGVLLGLDWQTIAIVVLVVVVGVLAVGMIVLWREMTHKRDV